MLSPASSPFRELRVELLVDDKAQGDQSVQQTHLREAYPKSESPLKCE